MKDKKLTVVHSDTASASPVENADSEVQNLYEVLKELPKPETAMKLNASQKKWWYWFGYEFITTEQFTRVDLMHLQDAAVAMDLKCKLISLINQENKKSKNGVGGVVQKFTSGATNITGYQSALKDVIKILDNVSAHFGMSIKDRQKIKATEQISDNQLSLFDQVQKALLG